MAPRAVRLLAPLLLARSAAAAAASGATPGVETTRCVSLLNTLAGHDDLELMALCRAQLPQEQCRFAKGQLGSQPWSPEKVNTACAAWDHRILSLGAQGMDTTVLRKPSGAGAAAADLPSSLPNGARTLEDGSIIEEVQGALNAAATVVIPNEKVHQLNREMHKETEKERTTTKAAVTSTSTTETPTTVTTSTSTNTDADRFWFRRFRKDLREEAQGKHKDGISRFPGSEAVLRDMGLENATQDDEESSNKESPKEAHPAAVTVPSLKGAQTAAQQQKWSKTRELTGLERIMVSGAAWPFSLLLALVLAGVVAPLLRLRLALGPIAARTDEQEANFAPLVMREERDVELTARNVQ